MCNKVALKSAMYTVRIFQKCVTDANFSSSTPPSLCLFPYIHILVVEIEATLSSKKMKSTDFKIQNLTFQNHLPSISSIWEINF